MNDEKTYKVGVKELIALCQILNEYEEFNLNFLNFKRNNPNISSRDLAKVINGKKSASINYKKAKKFYLENKKVIDVIHKCCDFGMFVYFNYEAMEKHDLDYFYDYLMKNKAQLYSIYMLLIKLNGLDVKDIELNPKFNFTKEEYSLNVNYKQNFHIEYLDNIEVIPNYNNEVIKYKTNESDFKLTVSPSISSNELRVQKLEVNNLLFDIKKIPRVLLKEFIFDEIVAQKEQKIDSIKSLQNSILLKSNVYNLDEIFDKINTIINNINIGYCNDDLKNNLIVLEGCIEKLKVFSCDYDSTLCEEDPYITENTLVRERKEYNNRSKRY